MVVHMLARPELEPHVMPQRFAQLKKDIVASYPDFEARATVAFAEILEELEKATERIANAGSSYIPVVDFASIKSREFTNSEIAEIKKKGAVVVRNVVDDAEAVEWKAGLETFIKANPDVIGTPENDKQFFQLYWTEPQVRARAHPSVLATSSWMNSMYHAAETLEGVDPSVSLSYADRFRIRHPGVQWDAHPPHIDGGSMERWEDASFRKCFEKILAGNWREHDPYDLLSRINAKTSTYGRPNQSSIFRTFQGWLAVSDTRPREGTLQVFPDIGLSTAYILLLPFFTPTVPRDSPDALLAKNWKFDLSLPHFPGIKASDRGFKGPSPTHEEMPHLQLAKTMISVPEVHPGDMVFWHCDMIHAVEREHIGKGDSAVMYIPAVPLTPQNLEYVTRQNLTFVNGHAPPDFPQGPPEAHFVGRGKPEHIVGEAGRFAMGFAVA